jgi:NCS1 family nucleobase:cation symporter-1
VENVSQVEPKGYKENPALLPLPADKRMMGSWTFTWMMFSMNTCIPMFFLGPIGYSLGLNPFEVAFGAFAGNLAAMIVLIFNGIPGVKYGIPYPVQLRPSWGFKGAHIAIILRGIVGAGWYGIEAYNGSLAILMVLLFIFGYHGRDPAAIASASFKYVVFIVIPYVIAATLVMQRGLSAIAKVVNYGGPIMFFYFVWLLFYIRGIASPATQIPAGVGIFSTPFAVYLAVQTNWWATVCLNISDLARGLYADKRGITGLVVGPMIGVVVGQIAGSLLGYYLVLYAGYVTPQEIILYKAPGAVAIILGQLFAFLAPFSTDVTANIPPLMDIIMSTFKVRQNLAAAIAGVIGFLIAPWWAVEKGPDIVNYVMDFSSNYGLILGPIAGIMLADYYIVRKRSYDLQKLYTAGPEGYWYHGGYNLSAIVSFIIAIIISYVFTIAIGQPLVRSKIPPFYFPTNLSWYIGVIVTFILYPILVKVFKEE